SRERRGRRAWARALYRRGRGAAGLQAPRGRPDPVRMPGLPATARLPRARRRRARAAAVALALLLAAAPTAAQRRDDDAGARAWRSLKRAQRELGAATGRAL